jgi:hypothetical protein
MVQIRAYLIKRRGLEVADDRDDDGELQTQPAGQIWESGSLLTARGRTPAEARKRKKKEQLD